VAHLRANPVWAFRKPHTSCCNFAPDFPPHFFQRMPFSLLAVFSQNPVRTTPEFAKEGVSFSLSFPDWFYAGVRIFFVSEPLPLPYLPPQRDGKLDNSFRRLVATPNALGPVSRISPSIQLVVVCAAPRVSYVLNAADHWPPKVLSIRHPWFPQRTVSDSLVGASKGG